MTTKIRETIAGKTLRYLAEGRLDIVSVHGDQIAATCRGSDGTVYRLGHDAGAGWWCDCPSRVPCVHILAAKAVTTHEGLATP